MSERARSLSVSLSVAESARRPRAGVRNLVPHLHPGSFVSHRVVPGTDLVLMFTSTHAGCSKCVWLWELKARAGQWGWEGEGVGSAAVVLTLNIDMGGE